MAFSGSSTGSIFGQKPAGSLFGNTQTTGGNALANAPPLGSNTNQPSTSTGTGLFGQTTGGGLFGQTGQQQQQQQQQQPAATGGLFGQPSMQQPNTQQGGGGGLFGQSTTQQPSTTGGGLFGQTATQQPATTGGTGIFGQSTTQPATGGGLFGQTGTGAGTGTGTGGGLFGQSTTTQPSTGGGLFGQSTTTTQPSTGGGLFGQSTTQPSTGGGLFGQSTTQPSTGGGLFGQSTTQPSAGGGLFGQSTTTQQSAGGGLFGQQTNQQPAGGLFGQSNTQPATGGGLFGQTTTQPATGGGLFGQSTSQQPGTGGGLFGSTQPSVATPGGSSLFGRPAATFGFGQSTQQAAQAQAGQQVLITKSTKFNDLPDGIKQMLEAIDTHIQGRVQIGKDLHQRKLGEQPTKGQEMIKEMQQDISSVSNVVRDDLRQTQDLKKRVNQTMEDTIVAIRIIDAFRNPHSGSSYLKDHAEFPIEFFSRVTQKMVERLSWYKSTIEQIERKISSSTNQILTPQSIQATLQAQYSTFLTLASKTAAIEAELQKVKTLYTQLWREKTGSVRDPFSDGERIGDANGDLGLSGLVVI